jgi:hypothetical protein
VKIPWPLLGFSSRPPQTEKPGYVSDDSYMKALSYCQPLLLEGKKYPAAKYIGKKYLALHFYRKKISVLFPWAEKKLLHSLNLPTPPPPPLLKNQMVRPLVLIARLRIRRVPHAHNRARNSNS